MACIRYLLSLHDVAREAGHTMILVLKELGGKYLTKMTHTYTNIPLTFLLSGHVLLEFKGSPYPTSTLIHLGYRACLVLLRFALLRPTGIAFFTN